MRGGNDPLNLARSSFKFISRTRRSSTDHRIVVPDEGYDEDVERIVNTASVAPLVRMIPEEEEKEE